MHVDPHASTYIHVHIYTPEGHTGDCETVGVEEGRVKTGDYMSLQVQRVQCPLLASLGTRHAYDI